MPRTRSAAAVASVTVLLSASLSLYAGAAAYGEPAGPSSPGSYDVQANVPQVAGDPGSDLSAGFPTNKQNETTIAVNPTDNRFLVAGSNDEQRQPACGPGPVRGATLDNDCSFFPGVGTSGVYVSADGGLTWANRGLLDDQASWQGTGVISDGDPVLAYGPTPTATGFSYAAGARVYYASLATMPDQKGFEQIVVSSSDDNGLTWSAPVLGTTKSASADFNDKNWLAVDDSPTSPFFGTVYLSWTEFRSATATGNGSEPVMIAVSRDGGRSFSAPRQVSPAGNNGTGNGRQGSSIAIGPDGTAYLAFEQGDGQVLTVSQDGGHSWSRPAPIGPVADLADPIPGANFRTNSFPVIAADPRLGSTTVYAAWADHGADGGRIVVARSTDRGQSWSAPVAVSGWDGYAFFPGLDVAPSGRVDVGYQSLRAVDPNRFGTGNAQIDAYLVSSADGMFWGLPTRVSAVGSDPAVSAQNNLQRQFWGDYSTVVSGSTGVWFAYTDARSGVGCPAVDDYQQWLLDTGAVRRSDMADRLTLKTTGINPALSDPVSKPAPQLACPAGFGNTDVRVAVLAP